VVDGAVHRITLHHVKKTSVYLGSDQIERLERLARQEATSKAEVIRRAIAAYIPRHTRDRDFALARVARGPGTSMAATPERELLQGFGAS
jgi:predicted DNA-binding protein